MNTTVKEWLFNLNVLYNHIDKALFAHMNLYPYLTRVENKELLYDVDAVFISYILIYTNSYMDEWKIQADRENIKIRETCKPVFKYIDHKWSGIKKMRNNILAHNHRDKHKKSIHFNNNWLQYKTPINNIEIELLVHLLGLTIEAVNKHYKFDFESVSKNLEYSKQFYSPMTTIHASQVKENILNEMNCIIVSNNASES